MAEYVLIIKKSRKHYLFNLIIFDIKLKLTIAIYRDFGILMTLKNYQRVLKNFPLITRKIEILSNFRG